MKDNQTRKRLKATGANVKPNKTVVTGMQTELRTQILVLLNERAASQPEIRKELGAPPNKVRYEMEALKNLTPPLIEVAFEKQVRGTVVKFYRATSEAYIDSSEWPGVPDVIKVKMRGTLLDMIVEDAVAAVAKDAYDSIEDAHMSWAPMILDEKGWGDVTALLLDTLEAVKKIKKDSAERLLAEDAKGISCTVSMLGYGSANGKRKVGPPADAD